MISRRRLLILAAGSAAAAFAGVSPIAGSPEGISKDPNIPRWAMLVDVDKCTECVKELIRKTGDPHVKPPCVVACDVFNNVPEFEDKKKDPQWMRIAKFTLDKETVEPEEFYMPLLCNHCEHPACAQVCPTKATFQRPDGIVMIDTHRCIGCRYCMIACPYGARSFNFEDPREGLKHINPEVPTRARGVVEKCTFCVQIVDEAMERGENPEPACVKACRLYSKNALVFGNVKDPNSEISKLMRTGYVIQLRPGVGTDPYVFYKFINEKP